MKKSVLKLDALEILDWISLAPLIAFKNPSDFWLDAERLRPIESALQNSSKRSGQLEILMARTESRMIAVEEAHQRP